MSLFLELFKEHDVLKGLCLQAKELGEDAVQRARLLDELRVNLVAHARAEEETLYARMAQIDRADALEGHEEHHLMDGILDELTELPVGDERWSAKLEVLRETALHHLQEEEESLFPRSEKEIVGEEVETLGRKYRELFVEACEVMDLTQPDAKDARDAKDAKSIIL